LLIVLKHGINAVEGRQRPWQWHERFSQLANWQQLAFAAFPPRQSTPAMVHLSTADNDADATKDNESETTNPLFVNKYNYCKTRQGLVDRATARAQRYGRAPKATTAGCIATNCSTATHVM
jgi:hypothetical protein